MGPHIEGTERIGFTFKEKKGWGLIMKEQRGEGITFKEQTARGSLIERSAKLGPHI